MKKFKYFLIIIGIYILAIGLGFLSGYFLTIDFFWKVLVMDVTSTIVVWIFTLIFKNTSIYDPYWSVIPLLIGVYALIYYQSFNPISIIYLVTLSIWGIRLTINWCLVTTGFDYEDWRYKNYRENLSKPKFHFVNFFGLQMIPTLVVYFALSPMFILFKEQGNNYFSLFGILIMIFGILLEIIADHQMHSFLKETKEKVTCKKGLWNYSRHPNYLGELSIWVGTYVTMLICLPNYWFAFGGMILVILLFLCISIPLAEKRQLNRRSDYKDYKKTTSMLLILPHKHKK